MMFAEHSVIINQQAATAAKSGCRQPSTAMVIINLISGAKSLMMKKIFRAQAYDETGVR